MKIYCAGPLFNEKEKEEMLEIASTLENNGYDVFLPHRDGFEFANLLRVFKEKGHSENDAYRLLNKAIFILDVFQVIDSDGLILNINGRVPDEGAAVEAGIAWNAGKVVAIYKNDSRTLLNGSDNPLILGLAEFGTISKISDIPKAFDNTRIECTRNKAVINNKRLKNICQKGRSFSMLAQNDMDKEELCDKIINLLGVDIDV
jgi:nucleoside 2-deoxyribosyltransferase